MTFVGASLPRSGDLRLDSLLLSGLFEADLLLFGLFDGLRRRRGLLDRDRARRGLRLCGGERLLLLLRLTFGDELRLAPFV